MVPYRLTRWGVCTATINKQEEPGSARNSGVVSTRLDVMRCQLTERVGCIFKEYWHEAAV